MTVLPAPPTTTQCRGHTPALMSAMKVSLQTSHHLFANLALQVARSVWVLLPTSAWPATHYNYNLLLVVE